MRVDNQEEDEIEWLRRRVLELQEELGRHRRLLRKYEEYMGEAMGRSPGLRIGWTPEQQHESNQLSLAMLRDRHEGMYYDQIAEKYGCSRSVVFKRIKRAREMMLRGEGPREDGPGSHAQQGRTGSHTQRGHAYMLAQHGGYPDAHQARA